MLACGVAACAGRGPTSEPAANPDPATQDPATIDAAFPPAIVMTPFDVEGVQMNGITYLAQGQGPHPTALLLHGLPGNEKNLDLAQAIRRAGWNVVAFQYRGAWGSGGDFSFDHVLEDALIVSESVQDPGFAQDHRVDPERLAIVGHSMGGFAALLSGADSTSISCVVSLAGANLGATARAIEASPERLAQFKGMLDAWSGPLGGADGESLVRELVEGAERFDTLQAAPILATKPVLLIAGERDAVTPVAAHHAPMAAAIEREGAVSLTQEIIPLADHSFSGRRIALARSVIGFLRGPCAEALNAVGP